VADEFRSYVLDAAGNPFDEIVASVQFDDITKGRRGAVVVKVDDTGGIPIVRTTTRYGAAARTFGAIHDRLANEIRRVASLSSELNNALVEHYTNDYATMKRHSDQALDLAPESSIAIYSCYRDPRVPSRQLVVKAKASDGVEFDIPLAHGCVTVFSLATNRRFTHKITLRANAPTNDWIGITFRTSKTFVRFVAGHPLLPNGAPLTLADDEQRHALFQLRRRENDETSFAYPTIPYTISESDLRPPI
jgi:hypothetical protein